MQHPQLTEILNRLRTYLQGLYGDRLERLVLFGSQARAEADDDSDIDVMVVLDGEVDAWTEIERTGEFVADLCLDYSVVICNISSCLHIVTTPRTVRWCVMWHEKA
jgi:predicted nucleotidyltransferase